VALILFAVSFVMLGILGIRPAGNLEVAMARFFTVIYFGFFWLMPAYSWQGAAKPVPERIP
jgi:ubiquinol-cytochrome c reductase cytochrome b subunit